MTRVGVAPVGTATLPARAEPQTAGDAPLEQFDAVTPAGAPPAHCSDDDDEA